MSKHTKLLLDALLHRANRERRIHAVEVGPLDVDEENLPPSDLRVGEGAVDIHWEGIKVSLVIVRALLKGHFVLMVCVPKGYPAFGDKGGVVWIGTQLKGNWPARAANTILRRLAWTLPLVELAREIDSDFSIRTTSEGYDHRQFTLQMSGASQRQSIIIPCPPKVPYLTPSILSHAMHDIRLAIEPLRVAAATQHSHALLVSEYLRTKSIQAPLRTTRNGEPKAYTATLWTEMPDFPGIILEPETKTLTLCTKSPLTLDATRYNQLDKLRMIFLEACDSIVKAKEALSVGSPEHPILTTELDLL